MSQSPLLDTVNLPRDLRLLDKAELPQLCAELRAFLLKSVSATGGHFASNLARSNSPSPCIMSTTRRKTIWCGMSAIKAIRTKS